MPRVNIREIDRLYKALQHALDRTKLALIARDEAGFKSWSFMASLAANRLASLTMDLSNAPSTTPAI